jgi:hypothetical protein
MDVKRAVSHWGRNVGYRCSRIGCLRKKIGSKRDEVTREWRRLHNEELYDLYSSTNIIRMIKSEE